MDVGMRQRLGRVRQPAMTQGREQRRIRRFSQAGRRNPFFEVLIEVVMAGQLCHLAALLMQPHPAPPVLDIKIRHLHPDCPADPREGVAHQRDQRPIAQPDQRAGVDRRQQMAHFSGIEDGSRSFLPNASKR